MNTELWTSQGAVDPTLQPCPLRIFSNLLRLKDSARVSASRANSRSIRLRSSRSARTTPLRMTVLWMGVRNRKQFEMVLERQFLWPRLLIRQAERCERALLSGSQEGEILMHCFAGLTVWAGRVHKGHLDGSIGSAFGPLEDYAGTHPTGQLQYEGLQRATQGCIGQAHNGRAFQQRPLRSSERISVCRNRREPTRQPGN